MLRENGGLYEAWQLPRIQKCAITRRPWETLKITKAHTSTAKSEEKSRRSHKAYGHVHGNCPAITSIISDFLHTFRVCRPRWSKKLCSRHLPFSFYRRVARTKIRKALFEKFPAQKFQIFFLFWPATPLFWDQIKNRLHIRIARRLLYQMTYDSAPSILLSEMKFDLHFYVATTVRKKMFSK